MWSRRMVDVALRRGSVPPGLTPTLIEKIAGVDEQKRSDGSSGEKDPGTSSDFGGDGIHEMDRPCGGADLDFLWHDEGLAIVTRQQLVGGIAVREFLGIRIKLQTLFRAIGDVRHMTQGGG